MRYLQLITRRQRRGAEVFAAQLSDGLARNGHDVVLVALYPPPADALAPALARTHDLAGDPGRRLSYSLISQLRTLIERIRPDVVQANGSATLKYASLAKTLSRGRWPLVYRNIGIASHWLHYPGHQWWGRWLLREVGRVAAVSHHSGCDFQRTFRLAPSRVMTIPIGVDIPAAPGLPALRVCLAGLARIPIESEMVIHVGSFTPEKNQLWLIDAFAMLAARRPAAHLLLIGEGPLRERAESSVAEKGLGRRIHFLGTRPDVPALVGGADLLVLSSTTEGISGVILEAAAQCVPTVSTNVGSVGEAIDHGRSGLLVPAGDMPAFVAAMADLFDHPTRRREMGSRAFALASERYHMDGIVDRFQQLYTELSMDAR